jgi:radical SAM superfamily enzyme YgiQ (UPF0313 family)
VLLLHPKPPSTFWSFEGALQLAGQRVVDEQVRAATPADWNWAQLVILSAPLVQRQSLARLIAEAKAHRLPVAVGGPFATSTPEAPELREADFLLLDEGELSIPAFVAAVEGGAHSGRFHAGGVRADVSLSPVPRFDLLDRAAYHVMAVQFSRGCPYQCEFCDIIVLYGRRPRTKEPHFGQQGRWCSPTAPTTTAPGSSPRSTPPLR